MSVRKWAVREIWARANRAASDTWSGKPAKPNPWPKCPSCFRRRDPGEFCPRHPGLLCLACCPYSGNHPKKEDDQ